MAKKNIQIRLDEELKRKAEHVFKKIGIDSPTAVRIFFLKVVDSGGIPFPLQLEDAYSPKQLAAIDRLARKAKQGKGLSRTFSSVDDLLDDLHSQ